MYWATTTFRTSGWNAELSAALKAWKGHIEERHKLVSEVRAYRRDGGTTIIWQEGFANFNDYQALMEEEDDQCEVVMGAVFAHEVPGTRQSGIWASAI